MVEYGRFQSFDDGGQFEQVGGVGGGGPIELGPEGVALGGREQVGHFLGQQQAVDQL